MFFCKNVHMPWVSDGSKFIHPPADEIYCNLDSIHESWLWIAHSCSTRTYSNIYSDADTQTQIAHTRFTRKFLGGYFWAALLFIIVVVVVVIDMKITIMMLMTMMTPTTTTTTTTMPMTMMTPTTTTTTTMPMSTPTQPLSSSSSHDSYPESSSIASASRVWLATGRVCRKSVM